MKILTNIVFSLLLSSSILAAEVNDKLHKVEMTISIECPMSEELESLIATIPGPDCPPETENYDEWSNDCIKTLNQLILLIASGKTNNSSYSIQHTLVDEVQPQVSP